MKSLWNRILAGPSGLLRASEWWVYRQPPSVHAFIAGVLVAVAINLLTGLALAEQTNWLAMLSSVLFFLSALGFINVSFILENIREQTSLPGVNDIHHRQRQIEERRGRLRMRLLIGVVLSAAAIVFLVIAAANK